MAVEESKESLILSSVANYQTVNLLELMSLTPGLDDEDVRQTIDTMQKNDLVRLTTEGDDQFVSLTSRGYDYLSSQKKMQLAY
jgi:RIO-like serine/threonine protein kinase